MLGPNSAYCLLRYTALQQPRWFTNDLTSFPEYYSKASTVSVTENHHGILHNVRVLFTCDASRWAECLHHMVSNYTIWMVLSANRLDRNPDLASSYFHCLLLESNPDLTLYVCVNKNIYSYFFIFSTLPLNKIGLYFDGYFFFLYKFFKVFP